MEAKIITINKNISFDVTISSEPTYEYTYLPKNVVTSEMIDLVFTYEKRIMNLDKITEFILEYKKTKFYLHTSKIEKQKEANKYKILVGFFTENENEIKKFLNKIK